MLAARSAPCLAYVPRVACSPHAPPPAWQTCHAWHACRTLRPLPGKQATVHGMSVTQCFNLGLFKFRQLISEELEFLVVTHNHLIQSMENSLKLMRAGGMLMTKHISLPLQPYHVRFGTAPPIRRMCHTWQPLCPPPGQTHVPHVACSPHAPPPSWIMCHAWHHTALTASCLTLTLILTLTLTFPPRVATRFALPRFC